MDKPIVTIKRPLWYRGLNGQNSKLRRACDGKMCCLGFVALYFGFSEEDITGHCYPITVPGLLDDAEVWASVMAAINDDPLIDNATREARLIQNCKAKDSPVMMVFVD